MPVPKYRVIQAISNKMKIHDVRKPNVPVRYRTLLTQPTPLYLNYGIELLPRDAPP